eukprot:jgi/Orpsp1_1/1174103/evm.model.c7180000048922.1
MFIQLKNIYLIILFIYINCNNCNNINNNINDNDVLIDQTKILSHKYLNIPFISENYEKSHNENYNKPLKDEDYILNYKGGELEPEWLWAKNISIVYTWVDGSDANFQDLKSKYNGGIRN